jgi:hypothetical protein
MSNSQWRYNVWKFAVWGSVMAIGITILFTLAAQPQEQSCPQEMKAVPEFERLLRQTEGTGYFRDAKYKVLKPEDLKIIYDAAKESWGPDPTDLAYYWDIEPTDLFMIVHENDSKFIIWPYWDGCSWGRYIYFPKIFIAELDDRDVYLENPWLESEEFEEILRNKYQESY